MNPYQNTESYDDINVRQHATQIRLLETIRSLLVWIGIMVTLPFIVDLIALVTLSR